MLPSRCMRPVECCDSLDFDNRFPWHLKTLMICILSTCGSRMRID
ncbi:hypothetical protein Gotri_018647 [Gossypium trilobum]|uniref:Uncharacterized protein n=1 Tax=Gossypium trilobum TaxID=34281 RepID=A0A7J9EAA9_9ROSI|nr:hypothetical protein [Gossypium trilobum]